MQLGRTIWPSGQVTVLWSQTQPVVLHVPVGQHMLPLQHSVPLAQQRLPQTCPVGQHAPLRQVVPLGQQMGPVLAPVHTVVSVGQQMNPQVPPVLKKVPSHSMQACTQSSWKGAGDPWPGGQHSSREQKDPQLLLFASPAEVGTQVLLCALAGL
jgi:hypothetical protein